MSRHHILNEDFVGGYLFEDAGKDDHITSCFPKINLDAKMYYMLVS